MSNVPQPGRDSTRGDEEIRLARTSLPADGPSAERGRAEGGLLIAASLLSVLASWWSCPPGPGVSLESPAKALSAPRLDIRTAPWYEWTLLEGIGEARARRIVSHRESVGGFRSIEDLAGVPGLPAGWLDASRELLSPGAPGTPR